MTPVNIPQLQENGVAFNSCTDSGIIFPLSEFVTESGIQLLTAQKQVKRPGRKESLLYFIFTLFICHIYSIFQKATYDKNPYTRTDS